MKKDIKFLVLLTTVLALALGSQCMAQEKDTNKKQRKEIKAKDDWNKFLDAHEKAHMVQNKKNKKEMRAQKILRAAIIGGVAYYIGDKGGHVEMIAGREGQMRDKKPEGEG